MGDQEPNKVVVVPGTDGASNEPAGANVAAQKQEPNNANKSFDDLLKDPNYQSEYDKKVTKSLDTAKLKWKEEADKAKTEAEKLAGMKAEEKLQYELDKEKKRADDSERKLSSRDLKDEAIKIATSKDTEFDVAFLNLIDFENMTAEKLNEQTKLIKSISDKLVEKAINNFSKEDSPKNVNQDGGTVKKPVPKIF